MEVSLSAELMEILERLVGAITKVQFQYLFAIIPALLIFGIFAYVNFKPLYYMVVKRWLTWRLEKARGSSVVSLIHKSGSGGLFSLFTMPFISLDDSQKLLRALKEIPKDRPIDLILHTPGGLVIAAEQIARAIKERQSPVRAYIPQYAMSGGTLIALACNSIHMGHNALMGPLDPQLSIGLFDVYPAASIVKALKYKNPNRDDKTLILADISGKAITQMRDSVTELLADKLGEVKAKHLADQLCNGNWTHDYGINQQRALELGIEVDSEVPEAIYKVVDTYPCSSSVEYRKKKDKGDNSIRVHL